MSAQAGSEVSKKLKAAIRAKLEELGVYVDDELPDYIMVMIANKKEKSQMKDDLGLFIGKSTAKFVDWLFDLFDRLQNASSKPASSSKTGESDSKNEEKANKEMADRKKQEERERREKEDKERERERQKEREKDRERESEREKEKEKERERNRLNEQKRRDRESRDKKRDDEKTRARRSRSNTYSDDEISRKGRRSGDKHKVHEPRSSERKRVASTVVQKQRSPSPEQKVHSMVSVKRNIRPTGDNVNAMARSSMFLRAMNEASVSAGYGKSSSSKKHSQEDVPMEEEEDDMSDLDALPTKKSKKSKSKKSIRDRLAYSNRSHRDESDDDQDEKMEEDAVVVDNNKPKTGGPQMIIKLTGGQEAIKKLRLQDRIIVRGNDEEAERKRENLKRRLERADDDDDDGQKEDDEPKSKHDRIVFDLSPAVIKGSENRVSESPILKKWDGQIQLGDESETSEDEAGIDAIIAETNRYSPTQDDEELPPTHQLSGGNFTYHVNSHFQQGVPTYVPTPISSLPDQQNVAQKEESVTKERCVFWPKCTKGDSCQFHHPFKNCTNFPNCTFGTRCYFIHPPCRFDKFCTKKQCPFIHYGTGGVQPTAPLAAHSLTLNKRPMAAVAPQVKTAETPVIPKGALASLGAKLAASLTARNKNLATSNNQEKAVKTEESDGANENEKKSIQFTNKPIAEVAALPLTGMIPCRFAAACRNPVCHFKHPKECRFGSNCRNIGCYFYHKPAPSTSSAQPTTSTSEGAAKYKWSATASS